AEGGGVDLGAREVGEILKVDRAARGAVEIAAQGFTAEVETGAERVPAGAPGDIVERFPGSRVAALREVGVRAEGGETAADSDGREAAVERIAAAVHDAWDRSAVGVGEDGRGIERLVRRDAIGRIAGDAEAE